MDPSSLVLGFKRQNIVYMCILYYSYMSLCAQSCLTLCSPPGSSVHGIFPGKNTEVGCHFLLQRIFPTQGSNSRLLWLLRWQADSLSVSHLGSPCYSLRMNYFPNGFVFFVFFFFFICSEFCHTLK